MSLIEKALTKKEKGEQSLVEEKDSEHIERNLFGASTSYFKNKKIMLFLIVTLCLLIIGISLGIYILYPQKNFNKINPNLKEKIASKRIDRSQELPKNNMNKENIEEVSSKMGVVNNFEREDKKNVIPQKSNIDDYDTTNNKDYNNISFYSVQVGAYKHLWQAQYLLKNIWTHDAKLCPDALILKDSSFYNVRCGLFRKKQDAVMLQKRLSKVGINGVVIKSLSENEIKKNKKILKKSLEKKKDLDDNITYLLNNALSLYKRGHLQEALTIYNDILKKDSKVLDALITRGIIKHKIGDISGAKQDLEQALKLSKMPDPRALNALGVIYLKQKEYDKAKHFFQKANDTTGMINIAVLYWQKNDLKNTLYYLNLANKMDPKNPYVYYYKWLYFRQIKNFKLAEDAYNTCLRLAKEQGYIDLISKLKKYF